MMGEQLTQKTCVPCQGGISALVISEAEKLLVQTPGWQIKEKGHHLHKRYEFNDFLDGFGIYEDSGTFGSILSPNNTLRFELEFNKAWSLQ